MSGQVAAENQGPDAYLGSPSCTACVRAGGSSGTCAGQFEAVPDANAPSNHSYSSCCSHGASRVSPSPLPCGSLTTDEDGFFHTGDIAQLVGRGTLQVSCLLTHATHKQTLLLLPSYPFQHPALQPTQHMCVSMCVWMMVCLCPQRR